MCGPRGFCRSGPHAAGIPQNSHPKPLGGHMGEDNLEPWVYSSFPLTPPRLLGSQEGGGAPAVDPRLGLKSQLISYQQDDLGQGISLRASVSLSVKWDHCLSLWWGGVTGWSEGSTWCSMRSSIGCRFQVVTKFPMSPLWVP